MAPTHTWRLALLAVMALAATPAASECRSSVFEASLAELETALAQGCQTSEQLVARYLARIEAYEDEVNAIIRVNPLALERARKLDDERLAQGARGPLHGIPVLIKDNVDTADIVTTAGAVALRHSQPATDATLVRRLRDAGAIVVAKTNMSELARSYGRLGYSAVGGQTRNPYHLDRDASGSSTGSAVAVAANFGVLAVGTDTAGSVRGPASTTALVGLRPTVGLISRHGVVPVSYTLDTPGPMARTVDGVAAMLDVMAGADEADARSLLAPDPPVGGYRAALTGFAIEGRRIGIARDFMGGHTDVDAAVEQAVADLRSLGAEVIAVSLPQAVREAGKYLPQVIGAEFRPLFEDYLREIDSDEPADLDDVADAAEVWGDAQPAQAMNPKLLQALRTDEAHPGLADTDYLYTVLYRYPAARTALRALLDDKRLDALMFPTLACPPAPLPGAATGDWYCRVDDEHNAGYLRIASVTGFPDLSVPAGYTEAGLPAGLSLLGRPFSESLLLGIAYRFEQHGRVRRPPPTAPALHD